MVYSTNNNCHNSSSLADSTDSGLAKRTASAEVEETFVHEVGDSVVGLELPKFAPAEGQELLSVKIIGQHISTIFKQEVQSARSSTTQIEGSSSISIGISVGNAPLGVIESSYEGRALVCPNETSVCEMRSSASRARVFEIEKLDLFSGDGPIQIRLEVSNISAFDPPMISVISQNGAQPDIVDPDISLGSMSTETSIYFRVEYDFRDPNNEANIPDENIIGPSRVFAESGGSSSSCDSSDSGDGGSGSDETTGGSNILDSGG